MERVRALRGVGLTILEITEAPDRAATLFGTFPRLLERQSLPQLGIKSSPRGTAEEPFLRPPFMTDKSYATTPRLGLPERGMSVRRAAMLSTVT